MNTLTEKNKKTVDQFEKMSEEIIVESKGGKPTDSLDSRLWLLPRSIVHYTFNAITDEEKQEVEPLLRDLRSKAAAMINELPEMHEKKKNIGELINRASEAFKFRRWSLDDLDDFISLLDDEDVWRFIPEDYPDPLTPESAAALIETSNNLIERHKVHAVEWKGKTIGQARILFDSSSSRSAEISYWIGKEYWGAGLASSFVPMYTHESFLANPDIDHIYAKVIAGNKASIRVLEKAGYRYESFNYQNVEKYGEKLNTHIFGVYRASYI